MLKRLCAISAVGLVLAGGALVTAPSASAYYQQCNTTWVKSVNWIPQSDGHWIISIDPTTQARFSARFHLGAVWHEVNTCVPVGLRTYPYRRGTDAASAWTQLWCHAYLSYGIPGLGFYTGGATWDLETWRDPYPSIARVFNPQALCNW